MVEKRKSKNDKHALRCGCALLLLVVFISSLLIKPAHIVFSHHQHENKVIHIQDEAKITTNNYEYCAILDYEFCTFIPQNITDLPQVIIKIFSEQTLHTVACLASISSHLFQLRAPPVLA